MQIKDLSNSFTGFETDFSSSLDLNSLNTMYNKSGGWYGITLTIILIVFLASVIFV